MLTHVARLFGSQKFHFRVIFPDEERLKIQNSDSFLFFSVVEFGILLHENKVLLYETQSLSHFFTRVIFFTIASSSAGIS